MNLINGKLPFLLLGAFVLLFLTILSSPAAAQPTQMEGTLEKRHTGDILVENASLEIKEPVYRDIYVQNGELMCSASVVGKIIAENRSIVTVAKDVTVASDITSDQDSKIIIEGKVLGKISGKKGNVHIADSAEVTFGDFATAKYRIRDETFAKDFAQYTGRRSRNTESTSPVTIFLGLIVIIVYLMVVRNIARRLNRSVIGWCLLCFFLPALGGLILAYVASRQTVWCPQCGNVFNINGNDDARPTPPNLAKRPVPYPDR